jgi:hypothetical protein
MDELKETVETLIEMDEPEAMLATLQRAARRRQGERWQALADELNKVEVALNYRSQPARARGDSQPEPDQELTHADATPGPGQAATPAAEGA